MLAEMIETMSFKNYLWKFRYIFAIGAIQVAHGFQQGHYTGEEVAAGLAVALLVNLLIYQVWRKYMQRKARSV